MLATRVDGDSMRVIESASKGISCIVRASAKHEAITHIRSPIGAITKGIVGWNINHVFVERNDSSASSEEHTSELQSLMRISYAVFCLNKKNNSKIRRTHSSTTVT